MMLERALVAWNRGEHLVLEAHGRTLRRIIEEKGITNAFYYDPCSSPFHGIWVWEGTPNVGHPISPFDDYHWRHLKWQERRCLHKQLCLWMD